MSSPKPHPSFPDVPPLVNTVPGFSSETWVGVFAPAGTPAPMVERLNRAINEIATSPELRMLLEPDGMLPVSVTPAAFAARVKQELAQWKNVASSRRIVVE